jgi:hypothetical protein
MPTSDEGKWRIQPGAKHLLTNILPLGVGLCSALTIRCLDPSPGRPLANLTTLNDRLQQQSPPTDLCSNIYLIQDRWKVSDKTSKLYLNPSLMDTTVIRSQPSFPLPVYRATVTGSLHAGVVHLCHVHNSSRPYASK